MPDDTFPTPTDFAFHFVAGRVSIDFANTGGVWNGQALEDLHTPADLGRWLAESSLGVQVPATDADMAAARELRDALWRLARARIAEGDSTAVPPEPDDIEHINRAAALPSLAAQLDPDSGTQQWALPATAPGALSTIARDAIDLFSGPFSERIRECASHRCVLFFVDTSRPGQRRWCSMERCGNIAKTRGYRQRRTG